MFETATPQNYLNRIVEGESQPQITTLGRCLLISYDFLTYSSVPVLLTCGKPDAITTWGRLKSKPFEAF